MTPFTGDDTYPITNWLTDFNDTANLMEWNNLEKLIYAKRLLSGTAKLFLRSLGSITSWDTLKESLLEEFGSKLNSASIHKKLASRKMKPDETYQQYFLHMKELALHGNLEDEALIEYVIDGIRDSEINKAILYGATDIKQFRKKLEVYAQIKEHKMQQRPIQMTTGPLTMTLQKKDLPPRVARWALLLEEFDYKIEHRSGTQMRHVDALSRNPCKQTLQIYLFIGAYLGQRISMTIQRGNVASLLGTLPIEGGDLGSAFYLYNKSTYNYFFITIKGITYYFKLVCVHFFMILYVNIREFFLCCKSSFNLSRSTTHGIIIYSVMSLSCYSWETVYRALFITHNILYATDRQTAHLLESGYHRHGHFLSRWRSRLFAISPFTDTTIGTMIVESSFHIAVTS
ncbi:hypothetical protein K1T71_005787 [Dendrolimus kikuchii]|uniref:Uncharacterized protein n=1 Tax=Dendrolimus kikuchii TaxID=765133 RepID=A0ACC1D584_9NEOP|nr:hypothetical protein K1T71_005787 [Dendrolimus kikuchii]